jgi:hypothetical protein
MRAGPSAASSGVDNMEASDALDVAAPEIPPVDRRWSSA